MDEPQQHDPREIGYGCTADEETQQRAVEWAMTHSLADQFPGDPEDARRLAARLPGFEGWSPENPSGSLKPE